MLLHPGLAEGEQLLTLLFGERRQGRVRGVGELRELLGEINGQLLWAVLLQEDLPFVFT